MSAALVILDARGHVTWHNRAAGEIIQRSEVFVPNIGALCGRLLVPRDRPTALRFLMLIRQLAMQPETKTVMLTLVAPRPEPALLAQLRRLPDAIDKPAIAVGLADPLDPLQLPPPALLRQLWGLTEAEARLAIAVVQFEGLTAAARALAISTNTAKAQLTHVFGKTGLHSQLRLARALLAVASASREL